MNGTKKPYLSHALIQLVTDIERKTKKRAEDLKNEVEGGGVDRLTKEVEVLRE